MLRQLFVIAVFLTPVLLILYMMWRVKQRPRQGGTDSKPTEDSNWRQTVAGSAKKVILNSLGWAGILTAGVGALIGLYLLSRWLLLLMWNASFWPSVADPSKAWAVVAFKVASPLTVAIVISMVASMVVKRRSKEQKNADSASRVSSWIYEIPAYHAAQIFRGGEIVRTKYAWTIWPVRLLGGIRAMFKWLEKVEFVTYQTQTIEQLETEWQFTAGTSEASESHSMKGALDIGGEIGPQAMFRLFMRYKIAIPSLWFRLSESIRNLVPPGSDGKPRGRENYFKQLIEGTTQRVQPFKLIGELQKLGGLVLTLCTSSRVRAAWDDILADYDAALRAANSNPRELQGMLRDIPKWFKDPKLHDPDTKLPRPDNDESTKKALRFSTIYATGEFAQEYWRFLEKWGRRVVIISPFTAEEVSLIPHISQFAVVNGSVVHFPGSSPHDIAPIKNLSDADPSIALHRRVLEAYMQKLEAAQPWAMQVRFWRQGVLLTELQVRDVEPETGIKKEITELGAEQIKRATNFIILRKKLDTEEMELKLRKISAMGDVAKVEIWMKESGLETTEQRIEHFLKFHQVMRTFEEMAKAQGRGSNFVVGLDSLMKFVDTGDPSSLVPRPMHPTPTTMTKA